MRAFYLVSGTMCDARLWEKLVPYLPSNTPLVHADYTGQISLDAMIEAVIEQAPIEPSHIVGFSLGGYLAMRAALKAPEKFRSLSLIATSPYGLQESEKTLRQQSADTLRKYAYKGMSKKRLAHFLHPDHLENTEITNTILSMEKDLGQQELINQLLAPIERRDISAEIAALPMSKHLILAEEDQAVPYGKVAKFAELDTDLSLHTVKKSGHMIPLEAPEKLAEILLAIQAQTL